MHLDWFTLILRPSLTLGHHDAGIRYMLRRFSVDTCKECSRIVFLMESRN